MEVESLVPATLNECGVDEFLERLPEFDAPCSSASRRRTARGHVLRYVGSARRDRAGPTVGLVELPQSHPFANISLTDNIVRFVDRRATTRIRWSCRVPGAGPAVTAAGVFADLLRVCAYLGAKL